jgi:cell division initiation protein
MERETPPSSTSAADAGSAPAERLMRVAPLDLRQPRFKTVFRGFDKTEVVQLLTEAADDYEHALREMDRLRQDLTRVESMLTEHRDREANLRNTLLTAQRLSDEIKDAAQNEARLVVREAQGRADLLLQKAQVRLDEVERDINEMRLRRRGVEGSLEASIQALYHALEFIREQDRPDERVLLHRPRQPETAAQPLPRLETPRVRVIPRSGRTAVDGRRGDALLVRLAAPPVEGAANDALIRFLSDLFDLPRRDLTIVAGGKRRDKQIRISSLTEDQLARRLSLLDL